MSSASFGNPSSSVHHRVHPSSKPTSPTHGVVTTADPKSTTISSSRGTNNHAVSSSSSTTINPSTHSHRQPKFPHDVASTSNPTSAVSRAGKKSITYRHSTGQPDPSHPRHEVINLIDSDTEANSTSRKSSNPSLVSSARSRSSLQPPFDPIPRGSTKSIHRASASPSISSLIDPQPPPPQLSVAPAENPIIISSTPAYTGGVAEKNVMKVDSVSRSGDGGESFNRSPKSKPGTAPPSAAASPKPHRLTAPSTSGNGLLGGVLPGAPNNDTEPQLPNIHLHVPLNGEHNKYINFTKLAEERYGWAALNPRLAKARERMMRADSGDEMMMDGSESESNVEDKPMGGVDSAAEGKKLRKKRKNQDIYDKNDPFIDDTEMLWEEQAAASKDGFFVYSGPLVPEGEKPQIERY